MFMTFLSSQRDWGSEQINDLTAVLDEEGQFAWLAFSGGRVGRLIHIRLHPEDKMGEIYILAVSPSYQRQGVRKNAHDLYVIRLNKRDKMVMVETGGDQVMHQPVKPGTLVLNNGLLLATLKEVITNSSLSTIVGDKRS